MKDYAPIEVHTAAGAAAGSPTAGSATAVTAKLGFGAGSPIFARDPKSFGRPWITPGTPGLMHRIGGLEKDVRTGNISYDAENHAAMTRLRAQKVASVAEFIPEQGVEVGSADGGLAVVGWGSTYGALYQAVRTVARAGGRVGHVHIRYLNPFPRNLDELLARFDRVLVPEMNMGQLATLLRDKLGLDPVQLNKVTGQPFLVAEIAAAIRAELARIPAAQRAPRAV
jgi:2-oxoglutarate ferredoxin oxidoreductase subunit alpha